MAPTLLATHERFPSQDIPYSRNSSKAPLPPIPRRLPSAPDSLRVSPLVSLPPSGLILTRAGPPTTPAPSIPTSAPALILPPSPPDAAKGDSSFKAPFPLVARSSSSESVGQTVLQRRIRGQRCPILRPPEQSTPTPARAELSDDTPSARRQTEGVMLSRNLSESHVDVLAAAAVARSEPAPQLVRKKSGEPLKSSLKVKRTPARGSLTVITDPAALSSSKSAPATPAHKGVRFHSQLEHVKLFLAQQKPLAVSRDGSPTDTSGTDSEFPPFIYGRGDDFSEREPVMRRIDVPAAPPLAQDTRDVAVENIDLVGTTIEGVVRVRNIAFEKWVAVRFTLDKWQTTSEVTARYKDSLADGTIDRFTFAIKLADVLLRAEDKTLFLAVRYSVAGREIWDNNLGRNYQVRVVREKAHKSKSTLVVDEKPRDTPNANEIADLRRRLEQVVTDGRPSDTVGSILAQHSRRRWGSPSPTRSSPTRDATLTFKSEGSLAARYDFAASLRTPWRPPSAPTSPLHTRTNTYPSALPNSVPWPQAPRMPCGSPRDSADGTFFFPERDSDPDRDSDDAITLVPSLRRNGSGFGLRNHTRGGSIEISQAPGVKRTPPTSPFGSPARRTVPLPAPVSTHPPAPSFPRFNSFPPHSSPKQHLQQPDSSASEESTPSITSCSSSRSPSPSPDLSPVELLTPSQLAVPAIKDADEPSATPIHGLGGYRMILDRLCFYTGPGSEGIHEHPDFMPRSFSASSVEEFLSAGQSLPLGGTPYRSPPATPRARGRVSVTASDDELQRSGSATPTGRMMRCLPHTPTPLKV